MGCLVNAGVGFADVVKNGCAGVGMEALDGFVVGEELEVDGEFEFSADSWDTARDISAIDGAGIPSVGGDGDRGHNACKCGSVVGGDGDSFVEVSEEPLYADGFVVTSCSGVEFEAQN